MVKFIHLIVIILLTLLTQVGGVIYLLSILLFRKKSWWKKGALFIVLYAATTFLIVPPLAKYLGRVPVKGVIHNYAYVLANRNYVRPELNEVIESVESDLHNQFPDMELVILDANFPFFDGFPLLPHLSHIDGKKVDIAFVYQHKNGELTNEKPSRSGYGVFINPKAKEQNQNSDCKDAGHWQYDYSKYFSFGEGNENLEFALAPNKLILESIVTNDRIGKVFLEPYLKDRLGVSDAKIRFQGCHSVRHDDHYHIQLK